jgi:NitT/TauT family transport system permease protein
MSLSRHTLLVFTGRLIVLVVILLGAELGVRYGLLSQLFFSSPTQIAEAFRIQLAQGTLLPNIGITVFETLLGLVVGSLAGIAVGLVLPQMRTLSRVIEPFLMVLNGIPVIVIAPLFILWLGLGLLSKIGVSVYIVFFAMFIPVYTASLRLEHTLVDALRVMGANRWQIFWKVVVPSSMPSVYTGLKIGSGLALIGAVIGEFVASRPYDPLRVGYTRHADAIPRNHRARRVRRSSQSHHRRDGAVARALAVFRREVIKPNGTRRVRKGRISCDD